MGIRHGISDYFNRWWIPIIITVLTFAGWLLGTRGILNSWQDGFLALWIVGMLQLTASVIFQLSMRRWIRALISFLAWGGMIASFLFILLVVMLRENLDGDHWADHLQIPQNISAEHPLSLDMGEGRPDSMIRLVKTSPDFQLYHSFQPGLFQYDAWLGPIEKGTLFFKAWEITQPWALSVDRLKESSTLVVENKTDSIRRFSSTHIFTIYEGDWGKPYAARFELWFQPKSGGKERKLMSKNYIIEGWQR